MFNYAEIKRFDGTQFGQVVVISSGEILPPNSDKRLFVNLTGIDPQPLVGWYWDGTQFSIDLPVGAVVPKRILTAAELWLQKFTPTERAKVWALCNGEVIPGVTISLEDRYRTAAFKDLTLAGQEIPLHNSETEYVIDALETSELLAPGRADEILER